MGGVENDDYPERLGSAGRAKDIHTIIVSGIAARALVWIGAAHRAPPTQRTPSRVLLYARLRFGELNQVNLISGTGVTKHSLLKQNLRRCFSRVTGGKESSTSLGESGIFLFVMAGLDPAIHVFDAEKEDVDARHEAGHDGEIRDGPFAQSASVPVRDVR